MTSRAHATLLCRVAGLRKAASGSEVGGLGGGKEMERLLSLSGHQLQEACQAVPRHVRNPGSFDLVCVCVCTRAAEARPAATVGLLQEWLFSVGAIRLGAEAAWQQLLQLQPPQGVDARPASVLPWLAPCFARTTPVGPLPWNGPLEGLQRLARP